MGILQDLQPYFFLVLAVVLGGIYYFGAKRPANFSVPMPDSERIAHSLSRTEALARVKAIAGRSRTYRIAQENAAEGMVVLTDRTSLMHFSNFYPIFVYEHDVLIGIASKFNVKDRGFNKKHAEAIEAVRSALNG